MFKLKSMFEQKVKASANAQETNFTLNEKEHLYVYAYMPTDERSKTFINQKFEKSDNE